MVVIVDHSREAGPAGAAAVTAKEECMMGTTCRMGERAGIPRGHTAGTTAWEMGWGMGTTATAVGADPAK